MPHKGIFTQSACVLLDRPTNLDELERVLSGFEIRGRHDEVAAEWPFGGPSLTLTFRPEVNGFAAVDVIDRPWPDHMGDAQKEALLLGAWAMGHFGPFAYPGNLLRAGQQSWAWAEGKTIAPRHRAFVRVRLSYVFGAPENALIPQDYQPLPELEFVTRVAAALLELPGALCYFNPNGEVLRDAAGVRESLRHAAANKLPPLELWCNVRLFRLEDGWLMMDTVGNAQLDLPDLEACFRSAGYDCGGVDFFLRDLTLYLLRNGEVIAHGDTTGGPGEVSWRARVLDESMSPPPRRVLRFVPEDGAEVPPQIAGPGGT